MFDPCGKAGGGYPGAEGPGAADFINTTNAKHGDLGSEVLKPGPSQATWKAGSEVETVWGLRSNHGGGFQWRLCPRSTKLTEACFQQNPLPFVGRQSLQFPNGTRRLIPSKYAYANGSVAAITADNQVSDRPFPPLNFHVKHDDLPRQARDARMDHSKKGGHFTQLPTGITWAVNPLPDAKQPGSMTPPPVRLFAKRLFRL